MDTEELFTIAEAARFLGIRRRCMNQKLLDGRIPYQWVGKRRVIVYDDLVAWSKSQDRDKRRKGAKHDR